MRAKTIRFAVLILVASVAFAQVAAQSIDRVFRFAQTPTAQNAQELANAIRAMTAISQVSVNDELRTLAVQGTVEQVALAEWLFLELDKPARDAASREYLVPGSSLPVIRIAQLRQTGTPQALQEIINSVRSMTDLQHVMAYYPRRAMVLRGTFDQVALAQWLILALDKPASSQPMDAQEYRMNGASDLLVRVFYLTRPGTPQQFQETVNLIRSTTQAPRVVPCITPRAVAMRGTPEQITMAARIVQERNSASAR